VNQSLKYKGCSYCKYFRVDGGCEAFDPEPIPIDIVSGQTKHTTPIFGQKNSIIYEDSGKSIIQRLIDEEQESETVSAL
jgi:hypothetical protein